jgi:flagellar FliL protein
MSAAPAADAHAGDAPPKKGNKKLIIIIAAVLVLVLGGGGAAFFIMKKKAAEAAAAAEEEGGGAAEHAPAAPEHKKDLAHMTPPTYVPLDNFTVNLADHEADRYAQIGVTLEVEDPKFAEQMKAYMPAIRNGILLVLSHKTAVQLLDRAGKEELAAEIMREAVRPMGIEIDDPEEDAPPKAAEGEAPVKKKKKKKRPVYNPVTNVLFSTFIIQ